MKDVHTVERGSGPAVLMLHGIGGCSASFSAQLDELGQDHHVVAWDAPGYAASPDPDAAPGIAGYAETVAELVDEIGEAVHLVGASWGGVIALELALQRPEMLRSLVLLSASRGSGRDAGAADRVRERAASLEQQGPEAFACERAPQLLSKDASPAQVEQVAAQMAAAIRLPGYRYAALSMAATDHSPRLRAITAPTLVLCGTEDAVTGPEESKALANGIPEAVYVSLEGAGHLLPQERPSSVSTWISCFTHITRNTQRLYR